MIKKNGGIFGRNPTYNDVVVEGTLTMKEAQVFDNDITINGDLVVNGTETVINTVELNVDDKNITMGAVVAKVGLAATTNITAGQFTVQLSDTSGLIPGMTVTKTSGTGAFGASPKIASVDSHTQITLTVAHATSGTIIFDTGGATDDTADGGGITLKGTTDKFIKWVKASVAWVFSDPIKAPDVTVDNLTASKPVFTDANKKLTSTGTLAIDQGGTGETTQQAAINALAGAVTAAQFLRGDGTDVKMSSIQASDVPTLNQNTTGNASTATTASNLKSNATTGLLQVTGPGAGSTRVMTTPDANFTAARTDAAQVFSGVQSFNTSTTYEQVIVGGNVGVLDTSWKGSGSGKYFNFRSGGNASEQANAVAAIQGIDQFGAPGSGGYAGALLLLAHNGTTLAEVARADYRGDLKVNTGNLVIGTSGKGIDFSADGHASGMTSELLNDYEVGTWTPVLRGSTTDPTISNYAVRIGKYTKIGNSVHWVMTVQVTITNIGSGYVYITGLPFAAPANNYHGFSLGLLGAIAGTNNGNYMSGTNIMLSSYQYTVCTDQYITLSGVVLL